MAPHSSRRRASRGAGAAVVLVAVAVASLMAGTGCGMSGASPPVPADPGVHPPGATPGKAPARASGAGDSGPRLDPSEEITPEELASIPEPLPASSTALKGAQDQPMDRVAQAPSGAPSGAAVKSGTASPTPSPGPQVWRVQIYASERRAEAERVSREATQALSVPGTVEREGVLFKVRLGGFATEAEAQALRELAIQAGYPGAFRIKTTK